ncbi:paramyosin-like isoform X1, partial [Clarias magur]
MTAWPRGTTNSVNEAEKTIQYLVVSMHQLENRVSKLEELLCEACGNCDMKSKECERERQAHSSLQTQNDALMMTLMQKEVSLEDANKKHKKSIAQLQAEKFKLADKVKTLQDSVQNLGTLLCKSQRERDGRKDACKGECEAHRILQAQRDEIKEIMFHKELLKIKEKHKKSFAQLKAEKSDMTDQLKTLQDSVQHMGILLCESQRQCDDLNTECEQMLEADIILQAEINELRKSLMHKEELLRVSLADADEKLKKSVAQLETEKFELTDQVKTMQDSMQNIGTLLCESQKECDDLNDECEQAREADSILQTEIDELKKSLIHKEEILKISLAEAHEKHQKASESIAQLEGKNSDLTDQVKTLRDTLQNVGTLLCQTQAERDYLVTECEQAREVRHILQAQNNKLKKNLKISIAEAHEKHQMASESITQLEAKNSDLTDQVKALQDTLRDVGTLLCESQMDCDHLQDECEQEREAYNILQVEINELKKTMLHREKLLKNSLAAALEKHQTAPKSTENSDQVGALRDTLQKVKTLLWDTHMEGDRLVDSCLAETEKKDQMAGESAAQPGANSSDPPDHVIKCGHEL